MTSVNGELSQKRQPKKGDKKMKRPAGQDHNLFSQKDGTKRLESPEEEAENWCEWYIYTHKVRGLIRTHS